MSTRLVAKLDAPFLDDRTAGSSSIPCPSTSSSIATYVAICKCPCIQMSITQESSTGWRSLRPAWTHTDSPSCILR